MPKHIHLLLLGLLVSVVAGCAATPEPAVQPPTQTPWIVVVTATPGIEAEVVQAPQATQTPWIIIVTPTRAKSATATRGEPTLVASEETIAPTEPAVATLTATRTVQASAPANTIAPSSLKYAAPTLVEPHDRRRVSWNSTLYLKWTSVGDLAEDEYYHLHLERPPPTQAVDWWGDWVYTKNTEYVLEQPFLVPFHLAQEHGSAEGYWWVRVVRKTGEDGSGKPQGVDIGAPSERRTVILEPRP
jgi:hypothetical protein